MQVTISILVWVLDWFASTIGGDFSTFHDNKYYLSSVKKMRAKQPSNSALRPNGNAWVHDTAVKERRRTR
tara:strand:- start:27232 stop:27441 length:210 start_codon:yes stop_codon:yes gene_type:complete